jgi:hypothetical protein
VVVAAGLGSKIPRAATKLFKAEDGALQVEASQVSDSFSRR